jgi:hypothetical protein
LACLGFLPLRRCRQLRITGKHNRGQSPFSCRWMRKAHICALEQLAANLAFYLAVVLVRRPPVRLETALVLARVENTVNVVLAAISLLDVKNALGGIAENVLPPPAKLKIITHLPASLAAQ